MTNLIKASLFVLCVVGSTISSFAQVSDKAIQKTEEIVTNKFPGTRFLDFQYEQFLPTDYTAKLYDEEMEKGTFSQKRFKTTLNVPFFKTKDNSFVILGTGLYKYESFTFDNVERLPTTYPPLYHSDKEDFHYFATTLRFVYLSKLFSKNVMYNANIIADGSEKGYERINATMMVAFVLKRDKTTTITAGLNGNTTPTAIFPVLPVFTLEHQFSGSPWSIDLAFPKFGYLRRPLLKDGRLSLGLNYEGELFFTYPDQPGFMSNYHYNRNEIKVGGIYEYCFAKNFILTARLGAAFIFWGQMKEINSTNKLITTTQDVNGYFNIGFSYNLLRK